MTFELAHPIDPAPGPVLRLINGGRARPINGWWERRSTLRGIVGGCPDHWWKATAPRTARCRCDRF